MPPSLRTTLVTGASGFIGRAVTLRLLERGHRVFALARPAGAELAERRVTSALGFATRPAGLHIIEGDLSKPKVGLQPALIRTLRAEVDIVFHCAGDTSFAPDDEQRFTRTHVNGAVALLEVYERAKLLSERAVRRAGIAPPRIDEAYISRLLEAARAASPAIRS